MLLRRLDRPLPAIGREARRHHVDARRRPALDQRLRQRLRRRAVGKVRDHEQGVVRHGLDLTRARRCRAARPRTRSGIAATIPSSLFSRRFTSRRDSRMNERSAGGISALGVGAPDARRARQAVPVGDEVEPVAHLELAVVGGVVDCRCRTALERRARRSPRDRRRECDWCSRRPPCAAPASAGAAARAAAGRRHRCPGARRIATRRRVARPHSPSAVPASARRRARSVCGASGRDSSTRAPPQSPYTPLVLR